MDESEEVSIVAYQEDHELSNQVRLYIEETKCPNKTTGIDDSHAFVCVGGAHPLRHSNEVRTLGVEGDDIGS